MTISTGGGKTQITGEIIDQSHMHGLLERISDLGLTLYSITPDENEKPRDQPPAFSP